MTGMVINACQTSPKADSTRRFLDCYVRVLEAEGNVLAEATMLAIPKGDQAPNPNAKTPIEIKDGIRYQGSPMTTRPNTGLTYVKSFPGSYVPEQVFSWDDEAGKRHTFQALMNHIAGFSFGEPKVSASKPAQFKWQGASLERGEALVLMWENPKENLTVPMEFIVQGSMTVADLPAAKMKELKPGEWTLYVVRKKLYKTEIDDVSAQIIMEFYSKTDTITVLP